MDVNGGGKTGVFGYVVLREGYKGRESEGILAASVGARLAN